MGGSTLPPRVIPAQAGIHVLSVIPAQAGIQGSLRLDPRFRGGDEARAPVVVQGPVRSWLEASEVRHGSAKAFGIRR